MKTLDQLIKELKKEGISEKVLKAIALIKREYFVLKEYKNLAYENEALPFIKGQTTSQPLVIANIIDELQLDSNDVVLEIGTGSGWQTLLLAFFSFKVITFEVDKDILSLGINNIKNFIQSYPDFELLYKKIEFHNLNIFKAKEFIEKLDKVDKVVFSAAVSKIPEFLFNKLSYNGIIIAPIITNNEYQKLMKYIKLDNKEIKESFISFVSFVLAKEN
ncbi:MAG: protein-L-isoaspartate O-methyltransferase [bacterium]|nr:protein-L-isoaspartate O-methyltransferase [bacterium]